VEWTANRRIGVLNLDTHPRSNQCTQLLVYFFPQTICLASWTFDEIPIEITHQRSWDFRQLATLLIPAPPLPGYFLTQTETPLTLPNFQALQSSGSQTEPERLPSQEQQKNWCIFPVVRTPRTHSSRIQRLHRLLRPDSCGVANPVPRIVEAVGLSPLRPWANRDPQPGEVGRAMSFRDADFYEIV
jgi:hypothetical protein